MLHDEQEIGEAEANLVGDLRAVTIRSLVAEEQSASEANLFLSGTYICTFLLINSSICISRMEYRSMYFPPEVDFLHSWANFQADRLYKKPVNIQSNGTYQCKCGGVKAYKKGRGLASGCCPSLKNA